MKHDDLGPHSRSVRWHMATDGQSSRPDDGAPLDDAEELAEIASLVRPLPDSVQPAPGFVERTRDLLLHLPGAAPSSDSHAA